MLAACVSKARQRSDHGSHRVIRYESVVSIGSTETYSPDIVGTTTSEGRTPQARLVGRMRKWQALQARAQNDKFAFRVQAPKLATMSTHRTSSHQRHVDSPQCHRGPRTKTAGDGHYLGRSLSGTREAAPLEALGVLLTAVQQHDRDVSYLALCIERPTALTPTLIEATPRSSSKTAKRRGETSTTSIATECQLAPTEEPPRVGLRSLNDLNQLIRLKEGGA